MSNQYVEPLHVVGRVLAANGEPVANQTIHVHKRVFDQGLTQGTDIAYGGTLVTDAKGQFDAYCSEGDVDVVVVAVDGQSAVVATSPTLYGVRGLVELDLVVGGEENYAGPTEYGRVEAAISALLSNTSVTYANADEGHLRDLAGLSKIDPVRVSALVLAKRLETEASALNLVDPDPPHYMLPTPSAQVFYALITSDAVQSLDEVRSMDASARDVALVHAGDRRVIEPLSSSQRSQVSAFFAAMQRSRALNPGGNAGTSIADILTVATVDLDNEQLRDFYDRYTQRTGSVEQFWSELHQASSFGNDQNLVKRVQFALALATVTGMNQAAVSKLALENTSSAATIAALATRTTSDWNSWLVSNDITPPASIEGSTLSERRQRYAERMASIIEHAVPTAVIKARIAAGGGSNEGGALQFLSNKPDFDFAKHRFSRFVRENAINLATIGDAATISAEMKSIQRLFSIVGLVGRIEQIRALRANGFDSSAKIVSTGRRRFLSTVQNAGLSPSVAESIFREASRATAAAVAIYAERSQAFRRGQLPVTRDDENEFAEYSELASVFGALDACDCGECRSAFGAAAYLADLLFFVEQCDGAGFTRDTGVVISGLDAIKARRPDLSRVKLSCANTNTKLPAIDLAIEALEVEVERIAYGFVPDMAYDRQTSKTEEELALAPEHQRDGAYVALATAVKPWALPYDRATDAALGFLSLSAVKPADFVRAVSIEGSLSRWQLARLELSMSNSEFTLLASDSATTPKSVWGYDDAIPSSMQLRTFLRRTGCTLEEAQLIVACEYPNQGEMVAVPGSGSALKITISNCSIDDSASTVDNLYTERARRIYRMVRLHRRTGLAFAELDVMLASLNEPSTPPSSPPEAGAMIRFAEGRAIQRRFGFSSEEVAAIAQTATRNDERKRAFARVLGLSAVDETTLESALGVSNTDARVENDPFGWAEDQLSRMRAFADGRVPVSVVQAFLMHDGPAVDASSITDEALAHSWNAIRAARGLDAEALARVINEEGARLLRVPQDAVEYLVSQCMYADSAYLLAQIAADESVNAPSYFVNGLRRAAKLMQMRVALGVDDEALVYFLRWLKRRGFTFSAIPLGVQSSPSTIHVDNMVEAARANVLGDVLGRSSTDVYRVLAEIPEMGTGVVTPAVFLQRLGALFGETPAQIEYVTDKLYIKPSPYVVYAWQSTRGIDRVRQALRVMKATGASQLDVMQTWTEFNSQAIADALRAAVQGKLGESAFRDAAVPVVNAMRERQRDALVAYLVSALGLESSDELYTRLLVDVEMSPCMLTTRVLQATSCVQNILQRASMNLDLNARWSSSSGLPMARPVLTTDDARTLGWMKNYRVWEAARRVLLYPENYLEPELRVDATSAFDDMSRALEQGDLDERATEDALRVYLRSLEEVSSLDVCAMTAEQREANHKIFHVFGRSRTSPRTYHYCRYDSHEGWSPWQAMKLDVGDAHAVPVVFGGRLYVYWPMFAEKEIVGAVEAISETQFRPRKRWDIRIAGARYEDGRWTQAFVSDAIVKTHEVRPKHEYSIRPEIVGSTLSLSVCVAQSHHDERQPMTDFELCHGVLLSKDGRTFSLAYGDASVVWRKQYAAPTHTERYESRLVNDGVASVLSIPYLDDNGAFIARADVMASNELRFSLVQPIEAMHFVGAHPFFYVDSERVYFMLPTPMYRLRAREVGSPSRVTPESAERLLASHDRSGVLDLTNVPRIGAVGAGVYSGPMRNIAVDPRTLSANAGRGRYEIPADVSANLGLVVRREANSSIGSRSSLVGFDTGAVVQGLLSPNPRPSPTLTQSPLRIQATRFDHPFVGRLRAQLERFGVDAIYAPPAGSDLTLLRQQSVVDDFVARYQPTTAIASPMPVARFDLNGESPSSAYNWELFFFAPWAIANRLRAQQKFEQAFRWMRFVFDPMDAGVGSGPERFWRFKPLADDVASGSSRTSLLELLDYEGDEDARRQKRVESERVIARWRRDPFNPHNIARSRLVAYERAIAMRTVELLIEWADSAFRRATRESLQEAAQLYVTASGLLGRRPEKLPERTGTQPKSYDELRASPPSGAIAELEAMLPLSELGSDDALVSEASTAVGPSLLYADGSYFCVPMNDELVRYWDLVADRLFKLRHCKDIEGAALDLPLYEAPIDPRLLVRARSLGVSISDALSMTAIEQQSAYRFTYLLARAVDFANDVRSMGVTLLSTIEKRDAEELAQVRQTIEREMATAIRTVREQQLDEAIAQRSALDQSRESAARRVQFYKGLVSKGLNVGERTHLTNLRQSRAFQDAAFAMQVTAKTLAVLPDLEIGFSGMGPHTTATAGGAMYGRILDLVAHVPSFLADQSTYEGTVASITAGHERRREEWQQQLAQAESDLASVDKQIAASDIRVAIARNELRNHELAFAHSERTERFLTSKFSNRALYDWMVRRLTVLHRQAYVLAFDLAKKAQVAFKHELGDKDDTQFVRFGQWDSQRSGLLAGDELHADLRRMESAFMNRNERAYEITKTVSLATLDPVALVKLRSTGSCVFSMPEAIFDVDHPEHERRIIRSVSVTVPSVSSAFDSVPMKVAMSGGKVRFGTDKDTVRTAKVSSIVLSHAQNDTGMFEASLRDERLLPFEGAGLIESTWELSLPTDVRVFDFESIADVVFTVRYTAVAGSSPRTNVRQALNTAPRNGANGMSGDTEGGFLLLSMKNDFPAQWQAYLSSTGTTRSMSVPITASRFPYLAEQSSSISIASLRPVLVHRGNSATVSLSVTPPSSSASTLTLAEIASTNPKISTQVLSSGGAGPGEWTLSTTTNHITNDDHSDLILIVRYTMATT